MHALLLQRAKEIVKISLGASAVNELLGGGLESRCITEIYGEFRSLLAWQLVHAAVPDMQHSHVLSRVCCSFRTGKTQICHTLCVTTQLPVEQGGGAGKVSIISII